MNQYKLAFLFLVAFASARSAISETLDGYWMTDGYGLVAEVRDGRARSYEYAGDICIPTGRRWERLSSFLDGIVIEPQPDGQSALIAGPFAQHRIRAIRIPSLPAACANPPADTPEGNFEAFAAFFARHYAFFDLYHVDWQAVTDAARKKVRPDMSDAELFQVMAQMMAPLRDGHLELNGRDGRRDLTFEPNVGRTHRALMAAAKRAGRSSEKDIDAFHKAFWRDSVQKRILQGEGEFAGNERIQYGVVDGDIGYITLVTVAGYGRGRLNPERDLRAINATMEDALQRFQQAGVRAVIVDISVNYGGFDFISLAIAERFASERTHAYTKYAGDAKDPIRTRVMLNPSEGTRFEGPVYVMTSNITISGGEILTMALRALPNVTHVGEPTRGALSDVLSKSLPNDWELSLSNEVYLDSKGIAWEGRGIKPDQEMTVFPDQNPVDGHLAAIQNLLSKI